MGRLVQVLSSASLACVLAAAPAWSADTPGQVYLNTGEIKWGPVPPNLPKGAKMAVLSGDPGKEGWFVARLMVPANYKIPAHWHSQDEDLTIISGTMYLAEGEKLDTRHGHAMKAGAFHHLPAKTRHYAYTRVPTVVQINGKGPFDINYVDPNDDPSKDAKH